MSAAEEVGAPRFTRSPHLVALIADIERLAATVSGVDVASGPSIGGQHHLAAARASLVLDGAPPAQLPELATAERTAAAHLQSPGSRAEGRRPAGWLDTLRVLEDPDDEVVRSLELLGALAAQTPPSTLDDTLFEQPRAALTELHRLLTRGLVADERVGEPRTHAQAVHDAATGRILFLPTEPHLLPRAMSLLELWLTTGGAREHAVITSGVLHYQLLRLHPVDAANGRLARAAARVVLRARGLDPDGLACPEPWLATDALGYHEEVARTIRRRDLTIWIERWAEAVAAGLRSAARQLDVLDTSLSAADRTFLAEHPRFTVTDHRAATGLEPQAAGLELRRLLDAGAVVHVPGSRGLRFQLPPPQPVVGTGTA